MKATAFLGLATFATFGVTMTLVAQEPREASAPSKEALARMTPGAMHAELEPLIGTWDITGEWRTSPDGAWEEFEATAEREWILDGRFVRETVDSRFMGQPFQGIGILGYDNVREHFTQVWIENMSTGTWTMTGRLEGDRIVFEGVNSDAMSGEEDRWGKSVISLGESEQTYVGYAKDEEGAEFESMRMTATLR